MVLARVRSCRDWIDAKKPRSKMLVSGLLGGWLISRMSNPSAEHASRKSSSSLIRCGLALSC